MNTKITVSLLACTLSLTTLSAMEMTTATGSMMKDTMLGETMMKKEMKEEIMKTDVIMKKEVMTADANMMKTTMYPSINLGHGSRGEHVIALQNFLIEKKFLVLPVGVAMGYFGGMTKKALIKYQESIGVNSTGYFGPKTRMMLHEKMGVMKKDGTMMKDTSTDSGVMKKVMMTDTMSH